MKLKSLFALALTLAPIGLSLPAVAGDRDDNHERRNDRHERRDDHHERRDSRHNSRNNYDGKYHYYKLSNGDYIYIGSKGDYWDSSKNYHKASDNLSYGDYYNSAYNWNKGNYYYEGQYYSEK